MRWRGDEGKEKTPRKKDKKGPGVQEDGSGAGWVHELSCRVPDWTTRAVGKDPNRFPKSSTSVGVSQAGRTDRRW